MVEMEKLRYASPNERRVIVREDLGMYHSVIIGAVYTLKNAADAQAKKTFFYPLAECLREHPWLGVTVGDMDKEKSFYQRVKTIDLDKHIFISDRVSDGVRDEDAIEALLDAHLDADIPTDIPLWKICVLPLKSGDCFVAFAFSHMTGDGISGPLFHRVFLDGLRAPEEVKSIQGSVIEAPRIPLPAPFDTPERLPISWSFLLKPLLAVLVPTFVANLLGLRGSASKVDDGTWLGTRASFFDAQTHRTGVRVIDIDSSAVEKALQLARKNDAKLTGVMHQLMCRAMSAIIKDPSVTNFVSGTAVNMRRSVGISEYEMGEYVSGCYTQHPVLTKPASGPLSQDEWAAARATTQRLATAATQLQDQPIGLLRYAPSIRSWTLGKVGQQRDCSWELSNVGNWDPQDTPKGGVSSSYNITKYIFAQPSHVDQAPICFNVASVAGGSLMCTVTWQQGALGVDGDEGTFIDNVCKSFKEGFEGL